MKILGMGVPELVIILIVALLIFGPKNLPKLGSALGKTVKNLREGMAPEKTEEEEVVEEEAEEAVAEAKEKAVAEVEEEVVEYEEAPAEEEEAAAEPAPKKTTKKVVKKTK